MKKLALVLAAAAVILAVVMTALYFFSPGEAIDVGGADSPYPYSCELKHQKLYFHITGDFPEGYRWAAETDSSDVLSVKGKKQTANKADFVLTPQGNGVSKVSFTLEQAAELPDRIFEIDCTFLFGSDGTLDSSESVYLELPGLTGGEGDGFTYNVAQLNPYTLLLSVNGDGAWKCKREGVGAEVNGSTKKECMLTDSADGQSVHELTVVAANNEGDGTLYIDGEGGKYIELTYHCTDMGEISLTGHQLGNAERPVSVSDAFDNQYGDIGRRLEYLLGEVGQSVDRWCSRADGVTKFPVGVLEFEHDGVSWKLRTSWGATEADFVGEQTPVGQTAAAEITANIYEDDAGTHSVWQAEGLNYMLESAEADRAQCEELTAAILTALFG